MLEASPDSLEEALGAALFLGRLPMARLIARLRVGAEGQEGMRAFLERRKPAWCDAD